MRGSEWPAEHGKKRAVNQRVSVDEIQPRSGRKSWFSHRDGLTEIERVSNQALDSNIPARELSEQ
jgi:hypothetical protein